MSKAERVCWSLVGVGAIAVVVPLVFAEQLAMLGELRWIAVLLGALVGPTAAISSFLFRARARARARLLRDENLVAHWTYAPDEWRRYASEDLDRERNAKWHLFAIVAGWCVLFGAGFPIVDPANGWWVTVVMAALVAIIALVIVASSATRHRRLDRSAGEARIGNDGVWLAGELHLWRGWGARLEAVDLLEGNPPCVAFTYSTPAKNHRQTSTVRVPIPRGHEREAADVAARFGGRPAVAAAAHLPADGAGVSH